MAGIEDMLLKDRLAKIDKNIASVRLDKNKFFDLIVDAGYVTEDGSADIKKFNRAANRAGIDVSDRSQKNLQKITKFLNEKSGGFYQNVARFSGKSLAENAASQSKGFLGEYAEQYSAATKEEFWNDAKKLQRKVNPEKISSLDKVKKIARGLKNKWAVPVGVTTTLLSKMGFGKALAAVGGPPGMVAGMALDAPMLVDAAKTVKEDIIDPVVIEPAAKKMVEGENILQQFFKTKMNLGGMMDINEMTRPVSMQNGGDPVQERKNEMLKAMTRKEGQRRADMNTGNPEMERMSTYGEMPQSDIIQLAGQIAMRQGDTSEENIRKIIMQLSQTLPSLQQDMSDERRSPITSGIVSLMDMLGLNRRTNLDRDVSAARTK
jgi:hypothetical protein